VQGRHRLSLGSAWSDIDLVYERGNGARWIPTAWHTASLGSPGCRTRRRAAARLPPARRHPPSGEPAIPGRYTAV